MARRVVRINSNRLPVFPFSLSRVPIVFENRARQGSVRFSERGIDFERLLCRRLGPGILLSGRERIGRNNIRVGQARISRGVSRILFDCLLIELDAPHNSIGGPFVPGIATLQVQLIRLGISCVEPGPLFLLFPGQL